MKTTSLSNYTTRGLLATLVAAAVLTVCLPVFGADGKSTKTERAATAESLTVDFSTSTAGGRYSPRNIHAVWVENEAGEFVKTLGRWAATRVEHLTEWTAADGTDVDGVSGATQSSYGPYSCTWDLRGRSGAVVADGTYAIRFELTDDNADRNSYNRTSFTFAKDGVESTNTVASQDGYLSVTITYTGRAAQTPDIAVEPASVVFEALNLAAAPGAQTVTVSNNGAATLEVASLAISGNDAAFYSLASPPAAPFAIEPAGEQVLTLEFAPPEPGYYDAAELQILSNDPDSSLVTVPLSGEAYRLDPQAGVSPTALEFADTVVGQSTLLACRVTNTGEAPLLVESLEVVGFDANAFGFLGKPALPVTVEPGGVGLLVTMQFAPPGPRLFQYAGLAVGTNDLAHPVVAAPLSGVGLGEQPETAAPATAALGGPCTAVTLEGSRLVVGAGAMLQVYDAAGASTPTLRGQVTLPGSVEAIALSGDVAWAALGTHGLAAVDISDPAAPRLLSAAETPGFAADLALSDSLVSVADGLAGLRVYDATEPSAPVLLGDLVTSGPARAVLMVDAATALVVDEESGILTVNLADPAAPALVAVHEEHEMGRALTADGARGATAGALQKFEVLDLSSPGVPSVAGSLLLAGEPQAVALLGDVAWVALGEAGLETVSLADPANPQSSGITPTAGVAHDVAVGDGYIVLAAGPAGLGIYDTSSATPTLVATLGGFASPSGLSASGALAWVAGADALSAVDLSTAASPPGVATFLQLPGARAVDERDGLAAVAAGADGLVLFDVANPLQPTELGRFQTAGEAFSVALGDGLAAVSDGETVYVVDVSDPPAPVEVAAWQSTAFAGGVAWSGDFLLVANGGQGLEILAPAVGAGSVLISSGSVKTVGVAFGVAVANDGSWACVADGPGGLTVVDLANPEAPVVVGNAPTRGFARAVAVQGDRAWVADMRSGLRVIDVSDPAAPSVVAVSELPGAASTVSVTPGYLLAGDPAMGLSVTSLSVPTFVRDFMLYE